MRWLALLLLVACGGETMTTSVDAGELCFPALVDCFDDAGGYRDGGCMQGMICVPGEP